MRFLQEMIARKRQAAAASPTETDEIPAIQFGAAEEALADSWASLDAGPDGQIGSEMREAEEETELGLEDAPEPEEVLGGPAPWDAAPLDDRSMAEKEPGRLHLMQGFGAQDDVGRDDEDHSDDYPEDESDDRESTGDAELDAFLQAEMSGAEDDLPLDDSAEEAQSDGEGVAEESKAETLILRRKIWDLDVHDPEDDVAFAAPHVAEATAPEEPLSDDWRPDPVVDPREPRRRVGRVKTRLLGFHRTEEDAAPDPFAEAAPASVQGRPSFPVGWMIVVAGPGRGAAFELQAGASRIGRGEDQTIRLDFGDSAISRDNHAAVAYDDESRRFFIGHGGKANLVRLNDVPVLATEPLADGDLIRIGETTLRLVALCGPEFSWSGGQGDHRHAAAE